MHINVYLFSAIALLKLLVPMAAQTVVSTGFANLKKYANSDCTGGVVAELYETLGKCIVNAAGTQSSYYTFYGDATNGNTSAVYFSSTDCTGQPIDSSIQLKWENGCDGNSVGAGQVVSTMDCFGPGGIVEYETYDVDTCHEVETQMAQPYRCTSYYPYNCIDTGNEVLESLQCGGDPNYYSIVAFNKTEGKGCSGTPYANSPFNEYFGCYVADEGYTMYQGSTCGSQANLPNVELTCAASPAAPAAPACPAVPACPACPMCPTFTCSSNSDGDDTTYEVRDIAGANVGLTVILLILVSYNVYEICRRRSHFSASNADVNNPIR